MKMCAPVLAVSLALVLGLVSCEPGAREKASAREVQTLREDVKALQDQAAKDAAENRAAKLVLRNSQEESVKKEQQAAAERDEARKKLEELKKAFDDYRAKYRISARAPGQRIAVMDCGEGNIYKDVEVIQITPGEMRFRHSSGLAKTPLGMLPPALRERFDYDPMEAETWLAANGPKKKSIADDEDDTGSPAGKSGRSAAAANRDAAKVRSAAANASLRKRYQADLNSLYSMARALQADQNCCPIHKKYQLASWSQEANQLKRRIAALPSGN